MELRSYWDFSDAARSEVRFQTLLDTVHEPENRFEIRCQIARTYGLRARFDEGHALLDELAESLDQMPPRAQAAYHLERGRVLNSSGFKNTAREHFELAVVTPDDELRVDALHMLANIAETTGEAERINLKALAEARASSDRAAQRWEGSLLNNLGWTYHDSGRLLEALDCFEKALAHRREFGDAKQVVEARWAVARCLRSLGRLEEARDIQLQLVELGDPHGYAYQELGEIYRSLGDDETSNHYSALADLRINHRAKS